MAESEQAGRTVVLGVDASEHSERAFDYGYAYYEEWQNLVEKSDKQVKELLECFGTKCKRLKELEKQEFKLYKEESNRPGEVICKLAEDEKANLIVMGSRGMGTLRRTFLGSVSDYCVHHAHIPVVVVPPPNRHEDHTKSS
ncbi:uncharacterized protein [Porites lutea]|uniref:uncharacterized protein isoform X2 n=1 Tax=Porites lutea TaxID=51062 RepID=UPI003CC6888E